MKKSFCFFSLTLSLVFFISALASADVIYITSDDLSVNYITDNGAGTLTESKDVLPKISSQTDGYPYYDEIESFKLNNQNRVFVLRRDSSTSATVMIYDPDNLSAPLVSKNLAITSGHWGSLAEFGTNIIFAKSNNIYKMNPTTGEIIDTYKYADNTGSEVDVLVHDGLIFAGEAIGTNSGVSFKLEIMDELSHVTGRVANFNPVMISSGSKLYFYDNFSSRSHLDPGVFLMKHEKAKNANTDVTAESFNPDDYATKVVESQVAGICPDGNGGFYYIPVDNPITNNTDNYNANDYTGTHVYHYDGTTATEVYSSTETIGYVSYDPLSKTLFIGSLHVLGDDLHYGNSEPDINLAALRANDSGKFEVVTTFPNMGNITVALVSKTPSGSTQNDSTNNNTDTNNQTNNNNTNITTPNSNTYERPSVTITDDNKKEIRNALKETFQELASLITDNTEVFYISDSDATVGTTRSATDVKADEVPAGESLAVTLPSTTIKTPGIYYFTVDLSNLEAGATIYWHSCPRVNNVSAAANDSDDTAVFYTSDMQKTSTVPANNKSVIVAAYMGEGNYAPIITTASEKQNLNSSSGGCNTGLGLTGLFLGLFLIKRK